jgi:hypothetical protein
MGLLKIIRMLTEIIDQPDSDHPEQGIEEWDQKILDEVTVKNPGHCL